MGRVPSVASKGGWKLCLAKPMQELTAYKAKVEAAEGGAAEPEKMNSRLHYCTRCSKFRLIIYFTQF